MFTQMKLKMLVLCSVAFGLTFLPAAYAATRYVVAPGTPSKSRIALRLLGDSRDQYSISGGCRHLWGHDFSPNGTYKATGAGANFWGVTTMVYIAKHVILRSVNAGRDHSGWRLSWTSPTVRSL